MTLISDILSDIKVQTLKKIYKNYELIDITYDAKNLIEVKNKLDTSWKEQIIKNGCQLHLYLVFRNNQEIILVKYQTIKYYLVGQVTYFLNNCRIIYEKDLDEWKQEQLELRRKKLHENQHSYNKIKSITKIKRKKIII